MLRLENVATPLTGVTGELPPVSVPPPALLAMASVTVLVAVVTVLPDASSMVTCTVGIGLPTVALPGCWVKTN
jgi:hypothetical protein